MNPVILLLRYDIQTCYTVKVYILFSNMAPLHTNKRQTL